MGILNITPDSFSDGGLWQSTQAAILHARKLYGDGAHLVDVGAESTRPGACPLDAAEEMARLKPVLKALARDCPHIPLSVDTRHGETARMALKQGVTVINDVSGLKHDPSMLEIIAEYRPGYVLMHSQGDPQTMQNAPHYADIMAEICQFFENGMARLMTAGVPENRIVLDPGIGFGKTLEHNLEIIRRLPELLTFGRPLLMGISRKSLFGQLLALPAGGRDMATAAASALLYERGAQWHRVHNAAAAAQALELAVRFRPV